jgi:uncharacterized protein YceH (UPF0502 family)
VIELGGHAVHCAARHLAASVDRALVGVQAGERGQQTGVDVDEPAREIGHKTWCEDAHEARQYHQRGVETVDLGHERSIESLARGKGAVVQRGGGHAFAARPGKPRRLDPVADDRDHLGTMLLAPAALARRRHNGSHVRAAARDQNHDVLVHLLRPSAPQSALFLSQPVSVMSPEPQASLRVHDVHERPLSAAEARVLATLMEKARTVPDSYPLTLNTLVIGCNQKSSREPVMQLPDAAVMEALEALRELHLVFESSGSRVTRYEHNFQRAMGVPQQSAVLLGLLMLRGPQTAGELRLNTERWYKFLDIASVDAFLEELQDRSDAKGGPLVVKLARAPGAREQRWAHLLSGPVDPTIFNASGTSASAATEDEVIHLTRRVTTLEEALATLQDQVQNLHEQLGMSQPGQD